MENRGAVLEVNGGNRALHQAPSLFRDSFRVLHPLTFNTVGGEEGIQEHSILDSGRSFVMVFSEEGAVPSSLHIEVAST